jgi:putative iron-dependent peroxidase
MTSGSEPPQTGIFALGTMSHAYLEFDGHPGADAAELVQVVASLREPRTTIGGVNLVAGVRLEVWEMIVRAFCPPGLLGFNEPIVGADDYALPATQHDIVIWLAGAAYDVVFDASRGVISALADGATLVHEMIGWPYHRDLDLTGFEDGRENPSLVDATTDVTVPAGSPGEGGSVLLLQQWEHDGEAWEGLAIAEQEQVIGRRKLGGEELDPKPATSHVARTDQDQFGKILRRNIGYGTPDRHGTIFVGFSQDRVRLDAMLESMVGLNPGPVDRLTRFAHALTGAYYFVPSSSALAGFAANPS